VLISDKEIKDAAIAVMSGICKFRYGTNEILVIDMMYKGKVHWEATIEFVGSGFKKAIGRVYTDGFLADEAEFKNCKMNGMLRCYDVCGKVWYEGKIKNDILIWERRYV